MEVSGKNVKIGIEFPKSATVLRKEVYDNVVEQNIEASKSSMEDIGFFAEMTKKIKEEKKNEEK